MVKLEDTLKYMSDKNLLEIMHNAYRDSSLNETPELKSTLAVLMKELMHRLSIAESENISELLTQKDFSYIADYDEEAMRKLLSRLERNFKHMYDDSLKVINNLAEEAISAYSHEYTEGMADDFHGYQDNFPHSLELTKEMRNGNAHNILVLQGGKFKVGSKLDLFQPAVRVFGLSKLKESVFIENHENLGWQDYRNKTVAAIDSIKTLGKSNIGKTNILTAILTEPSPTLQAFKDGINHICEALNLEPLFKMSPTQEYRKVMKDITSTIGIENLLEEEKSEDKSLRT